MPEASVPPSLPVRQTRREEEEGLRLEIHIPARTFLRIFAAGLLGYGLYKLWPLLLLVFLALFLAVTLHAFVDWLEARGWSQWCRLTAVIGGLLAVLSVGLVLIIPVLFEQTALICGNLPRLRDEALAQLTADGFLRTQLERLLAPSNWSEAGSWIGHLWSAGGIALGGISQIALLLVISLYLLIDGRKIYEWLLAFFSPLHRSKIRTTSQEISKVIFGYVSGQVITSVLVTIYSFAVLSLLQVPAAFMLAILAGVFDVLPLMGFFIAAFPAVLLALTVSPQTGGLVLGLYLLWQVMESYFIVPKVYGKSLRISTLTVLLGLLAGTLLAGIPGALAALPVIASYAAIERVWLKPFLREGVSEKHELQKDQTFGEQT